jgi:hypothetical protein
MRIGRIVAAASGALLSLSLAGVAGATQDEVIPMACYDHAKNFSKPDVGQTLPAVGYYTTTSACNDINIKPNKNVNVKVCFRSTGNCQASYKYARAGQWTVVATNVRNDTQFYYLFTTAITLSGQVAF